MWATNILIGVFTALYASVASASPTLAKDTTALLVPRAPERHFCGQMVWLRRECALGRTVIAWDDVCENADFQDLHIPGTPDCPIGTFCENTVDLEGDVVIATIRCTVRSAPGVAQPRKREGDPQIGSSAKKQATTSIAPSTVYHQLIISDDMLASVSAFFLSDDESHAVDPVNVIVGKIRGKEITVCKGEASDESRRKECYPSGRQQLWQGDIVDFSWDLQSQQAGSLKYLVWPSQPL